MTSLMLTVEGGHASLELRAIVRMTGVPLVSPVDPNICPGSVGVLSGLLTVPAQASLSPHEVIPVLHMGNYAMEGGSPGHLELLVAFLEILDVTSPPLLDIVAKGALDHLGQVHEVGAKALEALRK